MTGMRGFVCRGFISDGVQYGVPAALLEPPPVALADAKSRYGVTTSREDECRSGLLPT